MRIHIYCRNFAPAIGGMEKLLETLAKEFRMAGHDVHVVTETTGQADLPFPTYRKPGFVSYLKLARESDVILSAPLSLRRIIPQILSGRPIVIAHPDLFGGTGLRRVPALIKKAATRFVTNIVPSRFMGGHFPDPVVIMNPFDTAAFTWPEQSGAGSNILFVGRLVERKGVHLLIDAFSRIAADYPASTLTIVGEGPSEPSLRKLAASLGLDDRVHFTGPLRGEELTRTFQDHAIMAVPTLTNEPFGIVALEGLACGCRMVVARSGGLPEAVGPYALTFDRGDAQGLAACLRQALDEKHPPARMDVQHHLKTFEPGTIAAQYLEILEQKRRR